MANKKSDQLTQEISDAEQENPTVNPKLAKTQNADGIKLDELTTAIPVTPSPIPVVTLIEKWEGEYYMTTQPRFQAKGGETHTQNFRLQTSL